MRNSNLPYDKAFRQQLRRESTPCERILWRHINGRQINGLKFRRQHGFGPYVMDFYCPEIKLCIEVDGVVHESEEAKRHDAERTDFLNSQGIKVFRLQNQEIEDNAANAIKRLKDFIENNEFFHRYKKK
ncbi:endonuclease domain-containing protein [Segatella buccae]|uniref:endonuclease domain-containing protein n=1 Tax=Segatella buccae TaxID=28126 RepID=UPI0028E8D6E1|nr:endonuclease domain-containing protein [Segatella buccae]